MCQGLPCVGHHVRLTKGIKRGDKRLSRDSVGIIEEEDMERRIVKVYFEDYKLTVWLSEDILKSHKV